MKITTNCYTLYLHADAQGLTYLGFSDDEHFQTEAEKQEAATQYLAQARAELDEYFAGQRQTFDVPLHFVVGTTFQQKVWQALLAIPIGETRNYQEIAEAAGSPKACRAVGQANKANPIAIIVPCHRVIGKNGSMTGYMGKEQEGIAIKKQLLMLEKQSKNSSVPSI